MNWCTSAVMYMSQNMSQGVCNAVVDLCRWAFIWCCYWCWLKLKKWMRERRRKIKIKMVIERLGVQMLNIVLSNVGSVSTTLKELGCCFVNFTSQLGFFLCCFILAINERGLCQQWVLWLCYFLETTAFLRLFRTFFSPGVWILPFLFLLCNVE